MLLADAGAVSHTSCRRQIPIESAAPLAALPCRNASRRRCGKCARWEARRCGEAAFALSGEKIHLIVPIEMHLKCLVADLLALLELLFDVRLAGGGQECREPVLLRRGVGIARSAIRACASRRPRSPSRTFDHNASSVCRSRVNPTGSGPWRFRRAWPFQLREPARRRSRACLPQARLPRRADRSPAASC
jgi:hypothetical protein